MPRGTAAPIPPPSERRAPSPPGSRRWYCPFLPLGRRCGPSRAAEPRGAAFGTPRFPSLYLDRSSRTTCGAAFHAGTPPRPGAVEQPSPPRPVVLSARRFPRLPRLGAATAPGNKHGVNN